MNKTLLGLALAAAMAAPMTASAWAPDGEVTVIVAYKAGSGTDTGARLLSLKAEKYVGKPLVIQNLPGADGKIGWTELVRAKPDGRTIGFINLPTFTTLTALSKPPFKVNQVVPIANHLTETGVIVVKADSPYKTLKSLVAAMKKKPTMRASTDGTKASNHTAAQLFARSAGVKYKAVPYGGTADQLLALRQGEVDFSCAKVADVTKLVKGDNPELRVLGVFDTKRVADFPDVPTLRELGYYPNWYGSARALVAPAGISKEILNFYVKAFADTMKDPEVIEAHKKARLNLDYKDNKELGALLKSQQKFCKDVISKLY
jgi:tripartite-type tricarboxylate transporter receptor subunit TctC